MQWTQAQRPQKISPSMIREILKVTEKPGIISFEDGLPSPQTFTVQAFAAACATVSKADRCAALQYAASEAYAPLREWVAADLGRKSLLAGLPWHIDPAQVLITTGSQQALDLVPKILIDKDSRGPIG